MTWLYVPSTSCPSALASAGSNSVSELPSPERAASLTWRGKPQQPPAWSRAWKRGGFIRLLSGLTLEPSTLDRGVASFIASLRETLASPTQSPGSASETPTTGSSSTNSFASSTSAGLIVSSARTCRGTRTDSFGHSHQHWSDWATALRAEYSARRKSAQATAASDCSSWPTPSDLAKRGGSQPAEKRQAGGHSVNLEDRAEHWPTPATRDHHAQGATHNPAAQSSSLATVVEKHWPTPRANDPEKRGDFDATDPRNGLPGAAMMWATPQAHDTALGNPERVGRFGTAAGGRNLTDEAALWMTPNVPNGGRTANHATQQGRTLVNDKGEKVQLGLEHQARTWPSPTTRMHKGGGDALTRKDGKSRLDMLDWAAEQWSTPRASDGEKGGPNQSFGAGGIPLPTQAAAFALVDYSLPDRPTPSGPKSAETRRRLNPLFVEWLMGWPEGLSGFERSETEFARWLPLMRGALSTLCSPPSEPAQASFL